MASQVSVTKPAWVIIAPTSSSINVGTERTGSALAMNVIHSNRVLGILPYPFVFFIAVSRRRVEISLLKTTLSQPKSKLSGLLSTFLAEKAWIPLLYCYINVFFVCIR